MIFLTLPVTGLSLGMASSNPKPSSSCSETCVPWISGHVPGTDLASLSSGPWRTKWWHIDEEIREACSTAGPALWINRVLHICSLEVWIFSQAGIFSDVVISVNVGIFTMSTQAFCFSLLSRTWIRVSLKAPPWPTHSTVFPELSHRWVWL